MTEPAALDRLPVALRDAVLATLADWSATSNTAATCSMLAFPPGITVAIIVRSNAAGSIWNRSAMRNITLFRAVRSFVVVNA